MRTHRGAVLIFPSNGISCKDKKSSTLLQQFFKLNFRAVFVAEELCTRLRRGRSKMRWVSWDPLSQPCCNHSPSEQGHCCLTEGIEWLLQVYHKQCFSCKRCGRSMDSLAVAVGPGQKHISTSYFPSASCLKYMAAFHTFKILTPLKPPEQTRTSTAMSVWRLCQHRSALRFFIFQFGCLCFASNV